MTLIVRWTVEIHAPGDWPDTKLDQFCDNSLPLIKAGVEANVASYARAYGATAVVEEK